MKYSNTIEFLAEKTGLPKRVMRYIVDNQIVPIDSNSSSGRGLPRVMEPYDAFFFVLGAALVHCGVKSKLVQALFADANSETFMEVYNELGTCKSAYLVVADGAYYQMRTDRPTKNYTDAENRWYRIREEGVKAEPVPVPFQPYLEIILDMKRFYTITTK